MTKEWTPETLKEYHDAQFRMMQDEMDRRFQSSDRAFLARGERIDSLFDLVNIHLARLDDAMAQLQGSQKTANRLWTLGIAAVAAIAGIVALIVYNLPHK